MSVCSTGNELIDNACVPVCSRDSNNICVINITDTNGGLKSGLSTVGGVLYGVVVAAIIGLSLYSVFLLKSLKSTYKMKVNALMNNNTIHAGDAWDTAT